MKKVYWTRPDRRLSPDQVRELRIRYNNGELLKIMAYDYGMSVRNVEDIGRGRTYRDVHMDVVQAEPRRKQVFPTEARQIGLFFAAGGRMKDGMLRFGRSEATMRKYRRAYQQQTGVSA